MFFPPLFDMVKGYRFVTFSKFLGMNVTSIWGAFIWVGIGMEMWCLEGRIQGFRLTRITLFCFDTK